MNKNMKFAVCTICGLAFEDHTPDHYEDAKVCPRCNDIRQHRDTIILERDRLAEWQAVEIVSLPADFRHFQARKKDQHDWKIDMSGKLFGASYSGRIVIRARHPFKIGEIVDVRLMTSKHQRGEYTETHEYLVLEKSEATEAQAKLEWHSAYSKTTLKGLGRQYKREIVYSAEPLFVKTISGGVRSGRASTTAELSITHLDTYIEVRETDLKPMPAYSDFDDNEDFVDSNDLLGELTLQKLRGRKLDFDDDED